MIDDRIAKGTRCMVNCIAECNDITMGSFSLKSQLILYQSIFVSTILFNCEAWCNITADDMQRLKTVQLRYLKRVLKATKATSNVAVFMELGIMPIENVIHTRKLCFLHHILTLEPDDPVKQIYEQQKYYHFEKNWASEVRELLVKYGIDIDENEISRLSRSRWKEIIKTKIRGHIVTEANDICKSQAKMSHMPMYHNLTLQNYFDFLPPEDAKIMFKIRTGTVDVKANLRYKYPDLKCRLCGNDDQNLNHILNECRTNYTRRGDVTNLYTQDEIDAKEIVHRVKSFLNQVLGI